MVNIELYNEDCMVGMKRYPDKWFDLAICDPPYGIGLEYNNYKDTLENLKEIINVGIPEIIRISTRAIIFVNHKNLHLYPPPEWIFAYTWNTTGSYGNLGICQWQPILFYGKDIEGFGSINGVIKSDMVHISGGDGVGFRRNEIINHPCPKPKNIIKHLIFRFSNVGDNIIDPFLGSGTSAIIAYQLERNLVGFEIDKDYFEAGKARLEEHKKQIRLFESVKVNG